MSTVKVTICPITKEQCPLIPPCELQNYTGPTYCVEWIKLQQKIGQQKKEQSK